MSQYTSTDLLINIVLATIMLGVGLSLSVNDFRKIILYPKALVTGLSVQIICVPFIAFVIASLSGLNPEQKAGIVLVSTCASGASSNLITHLVCGNVALAVSMTTLNSFITLITLPAIVNIGLWYFLGEETRITLPYIETILQIFLVTIVPATTGVIIRRVKQEFADNLERPLKIMLPLLLAVVFIFKFLAKEEHGGTGINFDEIVHIFPSTLALNILAMLTGFLIAKVVRLDFQNQYTVAIEVGLHNTALALLVAGTILNSPDMEKPALVYAVFTYFSAILFVYAVKGNNIFRQ